jgi:transcriptional regulator with XRE-family HTH domain
MLPVATKQAVKAMTPKDFGGLVRRLRNAKGLSLREVARRLGLSAGFYSHGELGDRDLRKPEYVDRLAAILGVDVGELREAAGLEPLDMKGLWFSKVGDIGTAFVNAPAGNERLRRLYRATGWLLLWTWSNALSAWNEGKPDDKAIAKLEEALKAAVAVVERRHWGVAPFAFMAEPKKSQGGLYASADAVLDQVYRLHQDEIERLLRYEPK